MVLDRQLDVHDVGLPVLALHIVPGDVCLLCPPSRGGIPLLCWGLLAAILFCRFKGHHAYPVRHLIPRVLVGFMEPPLPECCTYLTLRCLVSSALISLAFMVIALARSPLALVILLVLSPLWITDFFEFRRLWVISLLVSRSVLMRPPCLLLVFWALLWVVSPLLPRFCLLRLRVICNVSPSTTGGLGLCWCRLGLLLFVLLDFLELLRDESWLLLRSLLLLSGGPPL